MRTFLVLLCLGLTAFVTAHAADETLYVRARPSVPLLSAPGDTAPLRQLVPGEAVIVLGRDAGLVNVRLDDGTAGWLQEADLTGAVPASRRVTVLEQEAATLRRQLDAAQAATRSAENRLARAQRNVTAARESGAGETARLATERDRLQEALTASEQALTKARERIAQLEMAQEAARLLAAQPASAAVNDRRFSHNELLAAAAIATGLSLLGLWLGASSARRRIRRRYNGLEL